jgi:hypothetical protein
LFHIRSSRTRQFWTWQRTSSMLAARRCTIRLWKPCLARLPRRRSSRTTRFRLVRIRSSLRMARICILALTTRGLSAHWCKTCFSRRIISYSELASPTAVRISRRFLGAWGFRTTASSRGTHEKYLCIYLCS